MGRTYAKMYDDSSKQKSVKQLTPTYIKWKKEGQLVVGAFITKTEVQSRLGGPVYNQYVFETDTGRVKFALGRAADGEIGSTLATGSIYAITYNGKEMLEGGRQVNRFNVEEIGVSDDLSDEGEDEGEGSGAGSGSGKPKK